MTEMFSIKIGATAMIHVRHLKREHWGRKFWLVMDFVNPVSSTQRKCK